MSQCAASPIPSPSKTPVAGSIYPWQCRSDPSATCYSRTARAVHQRDLDGDADMGCTAPPPSVHLSAAGRPLSQAEHSQRTSPARIVFVSSLQSSTEQHSQSINHIPALAQTSLSGW